MSQQLGGQPIIIMREGSSTTHGQDAQNSNFSAARAVATAVQSTLGPRGMDKMLVDGIGDITITNDGVTILKEMDIETRSRFLEIVMKEAKLESLEQADAATRAVLSLTKTIIGEELSQKIAACSPPDLREGWEAINVYFDEG